jgi:hypothetical protein
MNSTSSEAAAERAIAEIAARFPHLRMEREPSREVEILVILRVQPGLQHEIQLTSPNGDELYFSLRHCRMDWFPSTNPEQAAAFVDVVCGFLSGAYRLFEHHRGQRCVRTDLQSPGEEGWKTISSLGVLDLSIPWKKAFVEVRNA